MEAKKSWADLPQDIVVAILKNPVLNSVDQLNMARTCKKWLCAFILSNRGMSRSMLTLLQGDSGQNQMENWENPLKMGFKSMLRSWNELRPEMMVKIFHYLSPSSRYAASRTCKQWNDVFQCPSLWHSLTCIFSEAPPHEPPPKTLPTALWTYGDNSQRIALHCGSELRRLWVFMDCQQPSIMSNMLADFFERLSYSGIQLNELRLTKFTKWKFLKDDSDAVVLTLARFLRKQEHLSTLNIKCSMPVFFAAIILDAVSIDCMKSLKELCLITTIAQANSCLTFNKWITIWNNLEKLVLNYESINEEVISTICTTCSSTLKRLFFYLMELQDKDASLLPVIESRVWNQIKTMIPHIKVGFCLDQSVNLRFMEEVLKPEVPLTHLKMKKIFNDICFRYFKTHFAATLENLNCANHFLDTEMTEDMIGSVTELVRAASRLKYLTIKSKVPQDIIAKLCSLQKRPEGGFDLHIKFWKPTEVEKIELRHLQAQVNSKNDNHKFYLSFV